MARITLTSGFTLIPEGTHVFRIYNVDYDATFGKLAVSLVNAQGITHVERFSFIKNDGSMNEGACNSFSFFAKTALNNFTVSEIDHNDLVNHYIKATVTHTKTESNKEAGKILTFANCSNYEIATGFETEACEKALNLGKPATTSAPAANTGVNLKSLLG